MVMGNWQRRGVEACSRSAMVILNGGANLRSNKMNTPPCKLHTWPLQSHTSHLWNSLCFPISSVTSLLKTGVGGGFFSNLRVGLFRLRRETSSWMMLGVLHMDLVSSRASGKCCITFLNPFLGDEGKALERQWQWWRTTCQSLSSLWSLAATEVMWLVLLSFLVDGDLPTRSHSVCVYNVTSSPADLDAEETCNRCWKSVNANRRCWKN